MEIYLGALPDSMVPVDIEGTPMDNSKTSKQGVSRTYKGFDGYTPMMASHITSHGRQLIMGLGKSNVWWHIFADFCRDNIAINA